MRRYRARLRAQGLRRIERYRPDAALRALRFPPMSYLSPGEREVLRRFVERLDRLPAMPVKLAVFGSRARGDSHAQSDLDLAVLVEGARDPGFESRLSAIALQARQPYCAGAHGIFLRAVAIFLSEPADRAFAREVSGHWEVIWTRPERRTR
jgi:hypothetical protein